jgi:hypothetical protein
MGWRYFFLGPLLAIGAFGVDLLLLLPPFFDTSNSFPCRSTLRVLRDHCP